ncbi:uncharacterized protein LOC124799094 [Schistocerca piceifrons]|uniref:uncharacterized protein LOC124799094 n=1 Tax=Schistocerca piceifrons TaxID=274613 RepID=UPI001F5EEED9|nr:uncharacterized protein LOC124799094 [Schistocerca piceifrons]
MYNFSKGTAGASSVQCGARRCEERPPSSHSTPERACHPHVRPQPPPEGVRIRFRWTADLCRQLHGSPSRPGQRAEPNQENCRLEPRVSHGLCTVRLSSVQPPDRPMVPLTVRVFLSPLLIPLQASAVGRGGSPTPPGDSERFAMAAAITIRRHGSCLSVALTAAMTSVSADTVTSAAAAGAAAEMHISSTFWDQVCNESYCCLPKGILDSKIM